MNSICFIILNEIKQFTIYNITYIIIVNKYIFLMYSIAKNNIECVPMRNEEVHTLYCFLPLTY